MKIEEIARIAHQANKAYCEALGDTSQLSWEEAQDCQQKSMQVGVFFRINHIGSPASANHEEWLRTKKAEGWVYGKTKDAAKKEHPCMLPWEELPPELQRKDTLFKAVVEALNER